MSPTVTDVSASQLNAQAAELREVRAELERLRAEVEWRTNEVERSRDVIQWLKDDNARLQRDLLEANCRSDRLRDALEHYRKSVNVLQAMAGHPSASEACRNIIKHAEKFTKEAGQILGCPYFEKDACKNDCDYPRCLRAAIAGGMGGTSK